MKKAQFDLEVERPVFQYFSLALASTTIIGLRYVETVCVLFRNLDFITKFSRFEFWFQYFSAI